MFVLREQLAAGHARILQHGVRLRDEFLPAVTLGIGRISDKDPIVGRIFIGGDVELAVKELGAGSDFERRAFRLEILQIHLRLCPAFANINQQPTVIFGESDLGNILRIAAFAEDERILGGITSDLVVENLDVVDLFSVRDLTFFRMASVVESGAILHPSHAGEAGAIDSIRQHLASRALNDMERALFRSAGGRSIGHVLTVFSRKPPVERNGAVGGHFVHVNEHSVVVV